MQRIAKIMSFKCEKNAFEMLEHLRIIEEARNELVEADSFILATKKGNETKCKVLFNSSDMVKLLKVVEDSATETISHLLKNEGVYNAKR